MGWFGSSEGEEEKSSSSTSFGNASAFDSGAGASAPSYGSSSTGNLQQDLQIEQQKAMIQAIMLKLTETSFEKCVSKPSSALSSSETSCIQASVSKYLDTR